MDSTTAATPRANRDRRSRLYAREAMRRLPHLLTLIDRNPMHATYGCFDRQYWHYRTTDFPSGMYQECVLPFALAWRCRMPGNRWHREPRLREWAIAGIRFAAQSAHRDGSCDDYYPHERALGATAFALRAAAAAYQCLRLDDAALREHLIRRADWLARHDESGRLSNHQALAALALRMVWDLTGLERFRVAAAARMQRLLDWQSAEGWFPEYDGCDPGYLTLTIGLLAEYAERSQCAELQPALDRAVNFASYFQHPDGSFGGEYGSRNTAHFYPHGFELLARRNPVARRMADHSLDAIAAGTRSFPDDDRVVSHLVLDLQQAFRDAAPRSSSEDVVRPSDFQEYFREAGLVARRSGEHSAVVSVAKGGVLKAFHQGRNIASDCGIIAETERGELLVSHVMQTNDVKVLSDRVEMAGMLYRMPHEVATPWKQLVFRLGLLVGGRCSRDWVRRFLQRRLITGRRPAPVAFRRTIHWGPPLTICDELSAHSADVRLRRLAIGSDATSIYVATSNVYQESVLRPWVDLQEHVAAFNRERCLRITRTIA